MSPLVRALLEELRSDPDALRELADAMRPFLSVEGSPWLRGIAEAAGYLGIPEDTLSKLTSVDAVPCYRETAGGRLSFRRDELDAWRRREHRAGPRH